MLDPLEHEPAVCYINHMLGRHARNTIVLAAAAAFCTLGIGCVKNVSQKANSGKDYRQKGAKTIELDDGEARVKDIVTYPGGDRVDWKVFEIPEGLQGDMRVKLKWRPARPGMDLSFNIYDQWNHRIARVKPKKKTRKRSKSVKLKGLKAGKYFVQIYASGRMDAGKYTLSLRFKERKPVKVPSIEELAGFIDDPPTLPAVLIPKEKTPEEIAAEQEAAAKAASEAEAAAAANAEAAAAAAEANKPVYSRVRKTQKSGSGVIITIGAGRNKRVDKGWVGSLLRGSSKSPLPDGEFKVIKVTKTEAIAKVKLSLDQVKANPKVILRPSL